MPHKLSDHVLDNGLDAFKGATALHILSRDPLSYADVATYSIGNRSLTVDMSPSCLVHFDGPDDSTTYVDSTGRHSVTNYGNFKLKTSNKRFGSASVLGVHENNSYVSLGNNLSDFGFGTSDFTIDYWICLCWTGQPQRAHLDLRTASSDAAFYFWNYYATEIWVSFNNQGGAYLSGAPVTNGWRHIAVTRSGTTSRLFLDGTLKVTQANDTNNYVCLGNPTLGALYSKVSGNLDTNLDEFHVNKGRALWTASFTRPGNPYFLIEDSPDGNGRCIQFPATVEGTVTATGTATDWAIVDATNSRLLANGKLDEPIDKISGQTFETQAMLLQLPSH